MKPKTPLINAIGGWFSRHIYARHHHNWQFDRTITAQGSVFGIDFTKITHVFKCDCGATQLKEAHDDRA